MKLLWLLSFLSLSSFAQSAGRQNLNDLMKVGGNQNFDLRSMTALDNLMGPRRTDCQISPDDELEKEIHATLHLAQVEGGDQRRDMKPLVSGKYGVGARIKTDSVLKDSRFDVQAGPGGGRVRVNIPIR